MADSKLSALTELTAFDGDEEFYVVDDDDGTPVSRRMTVENVAAGLAARTELSGTYAPLIQAGAKGWRNSAWTITGPAGTYVTVPFDSETYDTGTIFNTSTGEFTVPSAGIYAVKSRISVTFGANTERWLYAAFVNGTEMARGTDTTFVTGMGNMALQVAADLKLNASDVVTFRVNQVSGTLRALEVGFERAAHASVHKIGNT